MYAYTIAKEDLDLTADTIKVAVLKALIREEKIIEEEAEEWCKTHTIILSKKGIFQTISNLWRKAEEAGGFYITVVKKV